jgi:hypothetical protein
MAVIDEVIAELFDPSATISKPPSGKGGAAYPGGEQKITDFLNAHARFRSNYGLVDDIQPIGPLVPGKGRKRFPLDAYSGEIALFEYKSSREYRVQDFDGKYYAGIGVAHKKIDAFRIGLGQRGNQKRSGRFSLGFNVQLGCDGDVFALPFSKVLELSWTNQIKTYMMGGEPCFFVPIADWLYLGNLEAKQYELQLWERLCPSILV